ncbi:MBL fold metallo-hydrolase [Sphingomonas canadensis]|uniref:MBL fold metallo-hydrolase n=1 Tax=Sphingomonas canadensis TaxID=1219257 RepID=A0ABW3H548_9SPHN|nr:MBL fold metallo-hydrolase [Sphingomonas canadensis]MCW3836213.1 MBL fold metallo-hydrolase [Sphingomonas canadensis]
MFGNYKRLVAAGVAWLSVTGAAPATEDHIGRALKLWDGEENGFINLCAMTQSPRIAAPPAQADLIAAPLPPPAKIFDNLYFVGSRWTNAWAITTPGGIILLDAMDNDWEAEHVIAAGLKRLGLDPADIRYVIVSHGHGDHYGGAAWLKSRYGARIVMSAADWDLTDAQRGSPPKEGRGLPPERDLAVRQGDRITLGGTEVEIYLTPGHTMGTISPIFDVLDHGRRHRAILWGGSSFNFGPARPSQLDAYLQSALDAQRHVRRRSIDVLLSNHPEYDRSIVKAGAIRDRPDAPNPFVVGTRGVRDALRVAEQCARATKTAWANAAGKEPRAAETGEADPH